jgi:hypothetical protein
MKKRSLLPLSLILLFQLIAAFQCKRSYPVPYHFIDGNFTVWNRVFYTPSSPDNLTDTLLPCQKNTVIRFDFTNHVYQVQLPDSACPLIPPFHASGSWKTAEANLNFVMDDQSFIVDVVEATRFDIVLPGSTYQGKSGTVRVTLYKQ